MKIPKGFIKESDGTFRRNKHIIVNNKIIRESTLEENRLEDLVKAVKPYSNMDALARAVISYPSILGNFTRTENVYIDSKGEEFVVSEKQGKNTCMVITPENNVYTLCKTDVVLVEDLEVSKENKIEKVKEIKDLNTKPVEIKDLKEADGVLELTYSHEGDFHPMYKDQNGRLYADINNANVKDVEENVKLADMHYVSSEEEPISSVKETFVVNKSDNKLSDYKDTFMMLGRLMRDNDYFLGMGDRYVGHLYYHDVEEQIDAMKILWNSLPEDEKPEWLSMEDIEKYEKDMTTEPIEEAEEEIEDQVKEEVVEEEPAEKINSIESAYFLRRPKNVQEVEDKVSRGIVGVSTYTVEDEISLSEEEYDNFADNLRQEINFLKTFRPTSSDADFTCIKVTAPGRLDLLVDNSGYNSAQYVGIER